MEENVKHVINDIRPSHHYDGGDIEFVRQPSR